MEKSILAICCALLWSTISVAQDAPREFEYESGDTTYIMKQYQFCLYLTGNEGSQSEEEKATMQQAHLKHLSGLEEKGLIMAGPFGDDGEKRGVLLFDLATTEEASALVLDDPMVIAQRLSFECHPLWLAKGTTLK
ncbi:MAG: YciI family protein [Cryomorphaceae bacterium]